MLNTSTIRISRSAYIEENIDVAILRLDTFRHTIGQPVTVRYYEDGGNVDALFAIGIKDGVGKSCYSLISANSEFIVHSVLNQIPDVTELVNGEIYLCNYNGVWNLLSLNKNGQKELNPNIPNPKIIREITTGYRWFLVGDTLKREDDFISSNDLDIDGKIYKSLNLLNKPTVKIENRTESIGTTLVNPEFFIQALDYSKEDITSEISLRITNAESSEILPCSIENKKLTISGEFSESCEFEVVATYILKDSTNIEFRPEENLKLDFVHPTFIKESEENDIEDPEASSDPFIWGGGKLGLTYTPGNYVNFYVPKEIEIAYIVDRYCNDISGKFEKEKIEIEGLGEYYRFKSNAPITSSEINIVSSSYSPDLEDDFDKKLVILDIKGQAMSAGIEELAESQKELEAEVVVLDGKIQDISDGIEEVNEKIQELEENQDETSTKLEGLENKIQDISEGTSEEVDSKLAAMTVLLQEMQETIQALQNRETIKVVTREEWNALKASGSVEENVLYGILEEDEPQNPSEDEEVIHIEFNEELGELILTGVTVEDEDTLVVIGEYDEETETLTISGGPIKKDNNSSQSAEFEDEDKLNLTGSILDYDESEEILTVLGNYNDETGELTLIN